MKNKFGIFVSLMLILFGFISIWNTGLISLIPIGVGILTFALSFDDKSKKEKEKEK